MTKKHEVVDRPAASQRPAPLEEPWLPLSRLRDEMDRMFDDFVGRFPGWGGRMLSTEPMRRFERMFGTNLTAVDLVETDTAYELTAELPGLDEKDVEVGVTDNILTLKGEKKEERDEKTAGMHVSERRYGTFQRSFTLPEDADPEQIAASFKKGVLKITCPKRPGAQKEAKKIEIKTE
jgi:HSP20 family protein